MSYLNLHHMSCYDSQGGDDVLPNIVVLIADDLGFNDVSWHNSLVKTPHLESLARAGVILEQHYSQPVCSPTRAALLTGRSVLLFY